MSKYILAFATLLIFSCNDSSEQAKETEQKEMNQLEQIEEPQKEEYCFLFTEGDANQDTNMVHLEYKGDSVYGKMNYFPYEKDASVGTISGRKLEDKLIVEWTYWQEGMETKERVLFVVNGDKLQQYGYINDAGKNFVGNEIVYEYKQVDCSVLPTKEF